MNYFLGSRDLSSLSSLFLEKRNVYDTIVLRIITARIEWTIICLHSLHSVAQLVQMKSNLITRVGSWDYCSSTGRFIESQRTFMG